jgi:hypothetical protein
VEDSTVADASTKPKGKPAAHVFVRVKPGSVVDVVDLPGLQVRKGSPVKFSKSEARRAVAHSGVLEIVSGD